MEILPEYGLAVFRVLDRLQDMRMPELIYVLAQKNVFRVVRIFREHGEIGLVPAFDALCVFARPAFPQLGVHRPDLHGFEIKRVYRGDHLLNWSVRQCRLHCFPLFKFVKCGTRVVAKDPFRFVSATFFAFNTGLQQSI